MVQLPGVLAQVNVTPSTNGMPGAALIQSCQVGSVHAVELRAHPVHPGEDEDRDQQQRQA